MWTWATAVGATATPSGSSKINDCARKSAIAEHQIISSAVQAKPDSQTLKAAKRFIKLVGEDIISVGFPQEQLAKYLPGAHLEQNGKKCHAQANTPFEELAFLEWKSSTRIKEPRKPPAGPLDIPEEWKPKAQVMKEENLPVFKMVYDLLLRIIHECHKMGKDFRYTLGEDLKNLLVRVEVCIYHANEEKGVNAKLAYIDEALEKMLEVKLYVRILHDSKQLSL